MTSNFHIPRRFAPPPSKGDSCAFCGVEQYFRCGRSPDPLTVAFCDAPYFVEHCFCCGRSPDRTGHETPGLSPTVHYSVMETFARRCGAVGRPVTTATSRKRKQPTRRLSSRNAQANPPSKRVTGDSRLGDVIWTVISCLHLNEFFERERNAPLPAARAGIL